MERLQFPTLGGGVSLEPEQQNDDSRIPLILASVRAPTGPVLLLRVFCGGFFSLFYSVFI